MTKHARAAIWMLLPLLFALTSACAAPAPVPKTVFDTGEKVALSTVAYRIDLWSPQVKLTSEQRGKIIAAAERGLSVSLGQAGIAAMKHSEDTPPDMPEAGISMRVWEMTVIPMITFPIPRKQVHLSMEARLWVNGTVFKTTTSSADGRCQRCDVDELVEDFARLFGEDILKRLK